MYTASYKEVSPLSICSRPAGQLKFESNYVYRLAIYKTQANIFWSFRRQLSKQSKRVESTAHENDGLLQMDGAAARLQGAAAPPPPPPPCPPPPPPPPPRLRGPCRTRRNGYVGLSFKKVFCSLQPRGFVTSKKHETARCCLLVR